MNSTKHFSYVGITLQILGIAAFFITLIMGHAGLWIGLLSAASIVLFEFLFKSRENNWFNPYILMITSPLLLVKYTSITDFRIRLVCFLFFAIILSAAYKRGVRKVSFSLLSRNPLSVFLTAFLIFALASAVIHLRGVHLSGDEPHYLMMTQSIVEDGDFDLKNNVEQKTYRNYIPVDVRFHGGEYKGKYLSFHLPGVSFLLIPFYRLYTLLGGADVIHPGLFFRLVASLLNAFFALVLFYILKRTFPGRNITGAWLLFLIIFPLVVHAVHLYPELPAATLMMSAYLLLLRFRQEGERGETVETGETKPFYLPALLMGLFLSLIPWFHVKYIPPLAVITLVILYHFFKPFRPLGSFKLDRVKIIRGLLFFVFPIISLVLLVIYCKLLYNSYSPTDIFPRESYWTVPFMLRLKVFFSYFLDQRDGLLFYSPLFFLAFWSFRRKLEGRGLLLGISLSYVLFHAFTSVRGAYAPAGRPLIFVLWIFVLFILHLYFNTVKDNEKPKQGTMGIVYKLLAGLSLFVTGWLFYYPFFVYQPVFSHTLERASGINLFFGSSFIPLWRLFPSFLTSPKSGYPATIVWIVLLAIGLGVFYVIHARNGRQKETVSPVEGIGTRSMARVAGFLVLFLVFAGIYCFYPHVHLISKNKYTGRDIGFFNNSKNFHYLEERDGFRIKGGNSYDIYIDRNMKGKDVITLTFTHTDKVGVTVRNGWKRLFNSEGKESSSFTLTVSELGTLKVGDRLVSHLGFETTTEKPNAFLWMEIK